MSKMVKTHKRRKSSRMHGRKMGTHGTGARKKNRGSGHRGGKGMSGSGKRADQKKTLITKLYGHTYFGKQGVTSRGTKRDKRKRISLSQIESNLSKYLVKGSKEINLEEYKILLGDKNYKVKNKLIIKAKEASGSAIDSIEKLGGQIFLSPKFAGKDKQQTRAIKKTGGEILLPAKKEKKIEKVAKDK